MARWVKNSAQGICCQRLTVAGLPCVVLLMLLGLNACRLGSLMPKPTDSHSDKTPSSETSQSSSKSNLQPASFADLATRELPSGAKAILRSNISLSAYSGKPAFAVSLTADTINAKSPLSGKSNVHPLPGGHLGRRAAEEQASPTRDEELPWWVAEAGKRARLDDHRGLTKQAEKVEQRKTKSPSLDKEKSVDSQPASQAAPQSATGSIGTTRQAPPDSSKHTDKKLEVKASDTNAPSILPTPSAIESLAANLARANISTKTVIIALLGIFTVFFVCTWVYLEYDYRRRKKS